MASVQSDLDSIFKERKDKNFGYMYSRTNEDLKSLFEIIDVKGKNVLSVLSSSDYLFSSLYQGVSDIDTFDINSITYRYYYLRKWLITNGYLDAKDISCKDIFRLISKINPKSDVEKDSVLFWKYYFNLTNSKRDCLYYHDDLFIDIAAKKVIYEDNLSDVADMLDGYNLKFKHMNICNGLVTNKKYDVIFLSNIMDYNRNNKSKMNDICENLDELLSDNGIIVMSHFKFFSNFNIENDIFSKYFDYIPLDITDSSVSYYVYKKKNKVYGGIKVKSL